MRYPYGRGFEKYCLEKIATESEMCYSLYWNKELHCENNLVCMRREESRNLNNLVKQGMIFILGFLKH